MGQPIPHRQLDADLNADVNAPAAAVRRGLRTARKVPEIVALFWVAKLLSTALGESTSDYLVYHFFSKYLAVALGAVGLAIALALQFYVRRYIAWVYWFAVVMVAVFGTMAADVLHIVIGVPYIDSTVFFAICLEVVFMVWYFSERTLSIHSITTPRREFFYWATVLTTFALGTAAGDMTAFALNLGFFVSGLFFIGLFLLPALAYRLLGLNEIVAFWFAYIVTRPLGASFADWFGKDKSLRGLGLGDGPVSLVLTILIVAVVGYFSISKIDVAGHRAARAARVEQARG